MHPGMVRNDPAICRATPCGTVQGAATQETGGIDRGSWVTRPGKYTKNDGKIHIVSWENSLFRLGHGQ